MSLYVSLGNRLIPIIEEREYKGELDSLAEEMMLGLEDKQIKKLLNKLNKSSDVGLNIGWVEEEVLENKKEVEEQE